MTTKEEFERRIAEEIDKGVWAEMAKRPGISFFTQLDDVRNRIAYEKAEAGMFEEALTAAMMTTRGRGCTPRLRDLLGYILECIRVTVETKGMDFIRVASLCEEALEVTKSVRCDGQCRIDAIEAVSIGTEKVLYASTKARLQKAREGELQKPDFKKPATGQAPKLELCCRR
ncbi:hypothetical protein H0O01_04115 [Candidatus Micrarchaeota archaeon]|nr:hypothetical protein [Candidatus Micrarchaeota archaeon]